MTRLSKLFTYFPTRAIASSDDALYHVLGFLSSQSLTPTVTDDTIDPSELDPFTLEEIKRVIDAYPVMSGEPYRDLDEYRTGKHDAYSTITATLSKWTEETGDSD